MLREPPLAPLGARLLATAVALATVVLPFVADWNETHLFNPRWSAHAKFHSAHTMALGAGLGLLALVAIWRRARLTDGLLLVGVYWATQALAAAFPGTDFLDPEFPDRLPRLGGVTFNQLHGVAVFLALLLVSHLWARRAACPPA